MFLFFFLFFWFLGAVTWSRAGSGCRHGILGIGIPGGCGIFFTSITFCIAFKSNKQQCQFKYNVTDKWLMVNRFKSKWAVPRSPASSMPGNLPEHTAEARRLRCAFGGKCQAESVGAPRLPSSMNTVIILVMSSYGSFFIYLLRPQPFSKDLTQTLRGVCVGCQLGSDCTYNYINYHNLITNYITL